MMRIISVIGTNNGFDTKIPDIDKLLEIISNLNDLRDALEQNFQISSNINYRTINNFLRDFNDQAEK